MAYSEASAASCHPLHPATATSTSAQPATREQVSMSADLLNSTLLVGAFQPIKQPTHITQHRYEITYSRCIIIGQRDTELTCGIPISLHSFALMRSTRRHIPHVPVSMPCISFLFPFTLAVASKCEVKTRSAAPLSRLHQGRTQYGKTPKALCSFSHSCGSRQTAFSDGTISCRLLGS